MFKNLLLLVVTVTMCFGFGYSQQLGLHVSQAELDLWRTRAQQGPYKTKGDVSKNSPGDWDRIVTDKNRFMANPANSIWDGISGTGCMKPVAEVAGVTGPKNKEMNYFVDAAFFGLVKNDINVLNTVKKYLLIQAGKPNLQPSDKSRWCNYVMADSNPIFHMANWVTQLLYIYEYLEIAGVSFSSQEKSLLDKWFIDWGNFHFTDIEYYLNKLYSNRNSYKNIEEIKHIQPELYGDIAYHNGPKTAQLGRMYNNRKANQVRLYGLIGIKYGKDNYINSFKRFTKEFLAFACYPNGAFAEFHRGTEKLPDLGLGYMGSTLSSMISVADALARRGDKEIYDFETTYGLYGTQGSVKKSLRWAIQNYVKLFDGTNKFYRFSSSTSLIDGVHVPHNWYSAHYCLLVSANLYYKDSYVQNVIDGKCSKVGEYPSNPAGYGAFPIWHGDGGTFPGVMFMFNHNLDILGSKAESAPAKPSNLSAEGVSASQINLKWTDNANNETAYVIEVSTSSSSGFTILKEVGANTTTYSHTGLPAGSTRYYRVLAKNSKNSEYSNVAQASTKLAVPLTPSDLSATASSTSDILLKWKDNCNSETSFILEISNSSGSGFTVLKELGANTTTFSHSGLQPGQTKYYRVKASNSSGNSNYSNITFATTQLLVPTSPSELTASAASTSEITLNWKDNSDNETAFVIEVSNTSGSGYTLLKEVNANVKTFSHTGLKPGETKYYRVKATNSSGSSTYSNVVKGTTMTAIPAAPSSLTANAVSTSEITLNWKDNSDNETAFVIEVSNTSGSGYTLLKEVNANVKTFSHTGLKTGETKYYRVKATNSSGSSTYSNVTKGTTMTAIPAAPSSLTASATSSSEIKLTWKDNSDNETEFILEVSTNTKNNFTTLKELGSNVTSYTHSGLSPNVTRFYRLMARNSHGKSPYSNVASAVTLPDLSKPETPANFSITVMSANQIQINWVDMSNNEDGFTLEYSDQQRGNFKQLKQLNSNTNSFVHGKLNPNQTVFYRIKAFNVNGSSAYSEVKSGTTFCSVVPIPSISTDGVTSICQGQKVTLRAPAGFSEYEWTSGQSDQNIIVDLPGTYRVKVKDNYGCWSSYSNEVEVTINELPEIPVITTLDDSLFTGLDLQHQWMLNNKPVLGANRNFYVPIKTGNYGVIVTDKNGCSATSISVEINEIHANLVKVYPNPSEGQFKVVIDNPKFLEYNIVVYSTINETIFQTKLVNYNSQQIEYDVDVRGFGRGIFLVKVQNSETQPVIEKILVR